MKDVEPLANAPSPPIGAPIPPAESLASQPIDETFGQLHSLIDHLQPSRADHIPRSDTVESSLENQLAEVRLGAASGLFMSLRAKHAATAAHSVRVAHQCSIWAAAMKLTVAERDVIEVAALLHDIGKIGIPDRILLKPSPLKPEEHEMVDRHWQIGTSILSTCCSAPEILEIIRHAPTWFDGTRLRRDCDGFALPLGSRMLAIVDAFDSMTTPQVYRRAMTPERAIKELCNMAGRQFDPDLVVRFGELIADQLQSLQCRTARNWLEDLSRLASDSPWRLNPPMTEIVPDLHSHFQRELLENMFDGVIFLDDAGHVTFWNRGAERLTGIDGHSMLQRPLLPSVWELRDANGERFGDDNCPLIAVLRQGAQQVQRFTIRGRGGKDLLVDAHAIPVNNGSGAPTGMSLLVHDISGQASLEERCCNLYEQVKNDPLTQLANRAEFDRVLTLCVTVHLERRLPCSLIICDLDRFKQINDTYGHPVGDAVIKCFSQLLKSMCRHGDLVARYGGEEFVMLCADCNSTAAAARAEKIRVAFSAIPQPLLGGTCLSASFGVTELQAGDDAHTMLNRADRALLLAKEGGRNTVVQLGAGFTEAAPKSRRRFELWRTSPAGDLVDQHLITKVPLGMAVEKLRGFISDHQAEIAAVGDARVELIVHPKRSQFTRRESDRRVPLLVELDFKEERANLSNCAGQPNGSMIYTRVQVRIGLMKDRDRRRANIAEQARQLAASVRSYLMADEVAAEPEPSVIRRATSLLKLWRSPPNEERSA